jgi:hypothetical protein
VKNVLGDEDDESGDVGRVEGRRGKREGEGRDLKVAISTIFL